MSLTGKELIILIACIVLILGIIGFIFRGAIKLIVSAGAIIILVAIGFYWLPSQVEQVVNGEKTAEQIVDTVINDFGNSGIKESVDKVVSDGNDYINSNKQSWVDAWNSLVDKLFVAPIKN